eukprot:Amastigsp_a842128_1409.p4 type:complete len:127 gc:universal Amastigsp_a842128_1409:413-33(-)
MADVATNAMGTIEGLRTVAYASRGPIDAPLRAVNPTNCNARLSVSVSGVARSQRTSPNEPNDVTSPPTLSAKCASAPAAAHMSPTASMPYTRFRCCCKAGVSSLMSFTAFQFTFWAPRKLIPLTLI